MLIKSSSDTEAKVAHRHTAALRQKVEDTMSNQKIQKNDRLAQKPHARHDAEYARWAGRVNAERRTTEAESLLTAYAYALTDAPAHTDMGVQVGRETYPLPKVAFVTGGTTLTCGAPATIDCCDHTKPAKDFAVSGGNVVGLCGKAGYFFRDTRKAIIDSGARNSGLNRLRTYRTQGEAETILAHTLGEHREEHYKECPLCNRPNHNTRR